MTAQASGLVTEVRELTPRGRGGVTVLEIEGPNAMECLVAIAPGLDRRSPSALAKAVLPFLTARGVEVEPTDERLVPAAEQVRERARTLVELADNAEFYFRPVEPDKKAAKNLRKAGPEVLRRTADADLPVVVFCVAYGRDADYDTLRALSDASGGFSREGDEETIQSLYKTLSTYF